MPKIVDEMERKNNIAEAAVEVFSENGFSETTVQQIADEANISKGSIYLYFDSKSDILLKIFSYFEEALHETFDRKLNSSKEPNVKIKELIFDLSYIVQENRPTIKVLFDFWSHSLHSSNQEQFDFSGFYNRLREKLNKLLQDGTDKKIFREELSENISSVLIGFFEGQLIQWLVDPDSPPLDEIKESGFDMIMKGIKAKK